MWHQLKEIKEDGDGAISGNVVIPPDSTWFSGHFPDEPVLPGLAQLGIVQETLERARGGGVTVQRVHRVRFRQVIKPEDPVDVFIKPVGERVYTFQLSVSGEPVCSGMVTLAAG
jgi:3-hydroxymyristoyl/3-hydroxydecanoyl-(acyl carrier protein) dehydratase